MKHDVKITIIILSMFLITQFIGLYVVDYYSHERVFEGKTIQVENPNELPYGLSSPAFDESSQPEYNFFSIVLSFVFAIMLLFLLMRIRAKFVIKLWFFIVTILALSISLNALLPEINFSFVNTSLVALAISLVFSIEKVYRKNLIVHNISELFIYPGIAAIFAIMLNLTWIITLLVLISIYDLWAVWRSGIMQKMAKYQMNELKIFSGFIVPYISKKIRTKIQKMSKAQRKKSNIKVNTAILGGGDVIFPIITSGVVLKVWGVWPAIGGIIGAFLGLGFLLFFSKKKKFYPAMPFITAGILFSLALSYCLL